MSPAPTLVAFRTEGPFHVPIIPASRWRDWMRATNNRSANQCLPLLMANEAGWALLNVHGFQATWDGRDHADGVTFEWDEPNLGGIKPVTSHFGSGIITWPVPYLFRTPPGWNLLARGPANSPRDGVSPLEGLIETDWAVATFTMNWKLTRPDHPVRFDPDEPFCMVLPQRRGELESFSTSVESLELDPETHAQTMRWAENRHQTQVRKFMAEFSKEPDAEWEPWPGDYFRGRFPGGDAEAPQHQTKLRLAEFAESGSDPGNRRASES